MKNKKESKKGFIIRTYISEDLNTKIDNVMETFTKMYGLTKKSALYIVALNYFCSMIESKKDSNKQ